MVFNQKKTAALFPWQHAIRPVVYMAFISLIYFSVVIRNMNAANYIILILESNACGILPTSCWFTFLCVCIISGNPCTPVLPRGFFLCLYLSKYIFLFFQLISLVLFNKAGWCIFETCHLYEFKNSRRVHSFIFVLFL